MQTNNMMQSYNTGLIPDFALLPADLTVLTHGAGFWQQHGGVSQKEWQAQRQALQADYRAKRSAATKHTHRTRKAARS